MAKSPDEGHELFMRMVSLGGVAVYIGSAVALIEVADEYVEVAEVKIVEDAVRCDSGSAFDL